MERDAVLPNACGHSIFRFTVIHFTWTLNKMLSHLLVFFHVKSISNQYLYSLVEGLYFRTVFAASHYIYSSRQLLYLYVILIYGSWAACFPIFLAKFFKKFGTLAISQSVDLINAESNNVNLPCGCLCDLYNQGSGTGCFTLLLFHPCSTIIIQRYPIFASRYDPWMKWQ